MRDCCFLRQEWFLSPQVRGYMQAENQECSWESWEGNWKLHPELRSLPLCIQKCADMHVWMEDSHFPGSWKLQVFVTEKKVEITFSAKDGVIVFILNKVNEVVSRVTTHFFGGYGNTTEVVGWKLMGRLCVAQNAENLEKNCHSCLKKKCFRTFTWEIGTDYRLNSLGGSIFPF